MLIEFSLVAILALLLVMFTVLDEISELLLVMFAVLLEMLVAFKPIEVSCDAFSV